MYIKMTEHNDWEGESWNFWLQWEGNENAIAHLSKMLEDEEDMFEFDLTTVLEEEVDILVKHSGGSYMNFENKVDGIFNEEKLMDLARETPLRDLLYKGQIVEYFEKF